METQKTACLIYVASLKQELPRVQESLEREGYKVVTLLVSLSVAQQIKENSGQVPAEVRACIEQADICVFLLPEETVEDVGLSGAAGLAGQLGKRIIGLVAGARTVYPEGFELAGAMIRLASPRLKSVLQGEDTWEAEDKSPIKERGIDHQRCQ